MWGVTGDPAERVHTATDFRLLQSFSRLADASDERLLQFAQRYGPLGLCKHGFALGHRDMRNLRCYRGNIEADDITRGQCAKESLVGWRRYISRARGILAVEIDLRKDRRVNADGWAWLLDGIPTTHSSNPLKALVSARKEDSLASNPLIVALAAQRRQTLPEQKRVLAQTVNHWLDECEVGVSLDWSGPGIEFRLGLSDPLGRGTPSLLIAIGVQLLRAVLRQESFVWCSDCGSPYAPDRWPRAGELHYCQDCGRKAANRIAQRRYKQRQKTEAQGRGERE